MFYNLSPGNVAELVSGLFAGFSTPVVSIVLYVLSSLGLYTIARRRGIRAPWLSWVPVADVWILGSLSDQYRYLVKGQYRSKRFALLVLQIICTVLVIALVVQATLLFVRVAGIVNELQALNALLEHGIGLAVTALGLLGVSIALAVIRFMALYDLYCSCEPANATVYLLLSIFISICRPILLFVIRDKDLGMPPRRQQTAGEESPYTI